MTNIASSGGGGGTVRHRKKNVASVSVETQTAIQDALRLAKDEKEKDKEKDVSTHTNNMTVMLSSPPQSSPPTPSSPSSLSSLSTSLLHWCYGQSDVRPLALTRILFGAFMITWVVWLLPDLETFFGSTGNSVFPRAVWLDGSMARFYRICLLDAVGPNIVLYAYWVVSLLATVCMTVGYKTRLSTILSFFLIAGYMERNNHIMDGCDAVCRCMLFWMMFVSGVDQYSVDHILQKRRVERFEAEMKKKAVELISVNKAGSKSSAAQSTDGITNSSNEDTATSSPSPSPSPVSVSPPLANSFVFRLLQLQFAWIYFSSAIWKYDGKLWWDGTAFYYALNIPHTHTRAIGVWFSQFELLVKAGTYGSHVFELLFPLFVFLPFQQPWLLFAGLSIGVMFHLGCLVLLHVGNFPYVMCIFYVLYLKGEWLESSLKWCDQYVLHPCADLIETLLNQQSSQSVPITPTVSSVRKSVVKWITRLWRLSLLAIFVLALQSSLPDRYQFERTGIVGATLGVWQKWNMFAPKPPTADQYLIGVGYTKNGTLVDPLRGLDAMGGPMPSEVPHWLWFSRWQKFSCGLFNGKTETLLPFARWVCRTWNNNLGRHGMGELDTFKLYRREQMKPLWGEVEQPWIDYQIWHHFCFDKATDVNANRTITTPDQYRPKQSIPTPTPSALAAANAVRTQLPIPDSILPHNLGPPIPSHPERVVATPSSPPVQPPHQTQPPQAMPAQTKLDVPPLPPQNPQSRFVPVGVTYQLQGQK